MTRLASIAALWSWAGCEGHARPRSHVLDVTATSIWGAAAMTYMLDGRQHVLIPSGSVLFSFSLPAN